MAKEKDELLDHSYDGIQEYDNDLPRWWLNIFWLTTIMAIAYLAWTHGWKVPQHEQLANQLEALQEQRESAAQSATDGGAASGPAGLLTLVSDTAVVASGKAAFGTKCGACHGMHGEGLVGPNLTDDHYLHGGEITEIRNVIQNGVPAKGMIAWGAMLSASEIDSLTAYIWTLNGTEPPNGKKPEGELVERAS